MQDPLSPSICLYPRIWYGVVKKTMTTPEHRPGIPDNTPQKQPPQIPGKPDGKTMDTWLALHKLVNITLRIA